MTDARVDTPPAVTWGTAPVHDRPTRITFAQLAAWAWFLYAFSATQALLRDDQGTSRSIASLHGTAMAVGGLVGALLAPRIIARWGRGVVLRVCGLAVAALVLVYTAPGAPVSITLTGVMLLSAAGTALMVAMNAFILAHQGPAGPAALTTGNAFAAAAGVLAPLAVGAAAATALGWRAGVWVVILGLVGVEIWRGRRTAEFDSRGTTTHADAHGRFDSSVYWSLAVIMLLLPAEFCTMFWGADLLRERCGFGPAAAAASLGAVTVGMLLGRIAGGRLAVRVAPDRLLAASIVIALAAFALAWSTTWAPSVLFGLFVVGIGLSVQWPLGIARVVRASGGLADRASAASSIAANIAMGVAPFALGVLADTIGFHLAFLLVPAVLVAALVLVLARPVR